MSDAAPPPARDAVVAAAIELFAAQGFDGTSVEEIARVAGVSRSTFFRQYGGKEDVVFADHDLLLERLRDYLEAGHVNPWVAVGEAALLVFDHFSGDPELARRRYDLVRRVPALREREIVTVFRYERLFDGYLRRALPDLDPVDAVGFAAAMAAVHNHVLRRMLRGEDVSQAHARAALDVTMRRFGVHPVPDAPASGDMVVAVFPRTMPAAEVARRISSELR